MATAPIVPVPRPARDGEALYQTAHTLKGAISNFDILALSAKGSLYVTRPTLMGYVAKRDELVAAAKELFDLVLAPDGERVESIWSTVFVADECERRRKQRRAADALQRTGEVECGDAPGESTEHEASVKTTTPVANTIRRPYRSASALAVRINGEREGIGVDDPLQFGQARVEALLHVRQRDDNDRDVEGAP